MNYVVGFLFTPDGGHRGVVLIRKNRPPWQKGKLNGVGGKIEAGENPLNAMRREFKEETGVYVSDWHLFGEMTFKYGTIYFYTAKCKDYESIPIIESITDETVNWYRVTDLHHFVSEQHVATITIKNLKWLIPLALDPDDVTVKITDLTIGHPNKD